MQARRLPTSTAKAAREWEFAQNQPTVIAPEPNLPVQPQGAGKSMRIQRRRRVPVPRLALTALACLVALTGCGSAPHVKAASPIPPALLAQARPIGVGERFHPPATGAAIGSCRPALGPRTASHVELFAANRVVILAAGIGVRPPWSSSDGRITAAPCYGPVVTLEPTGVVLARPHAHATLASLFAAWGQPLSGSRVASFRAPGRGHVAVFVDGRRRLGPPGDVPLAEHAEIVLEVGPYVPPHTRFAFPAEP